MASVDELLKSMAVSLEGCLTASASNASPTAAQVDAQRHILQFTESAKQLERFIIQNQNNPQKKSTAQKIRELQEEIQRKDALLEKFQSFFTERLEAFKALQEKQEYILRSHNVFEDISDDLRSSPTPTQPMSLGFGLDGSSLSGMGSDHLFAEQSPTQ